MSASAALAKLPSPLRDLVAAAAQDGSKDFGRSEKDKAEVAEWIDKVAQGEVAKPDNFKVSASRATHQPILTGSRTSKRPSFPAPTS